MEITTKEAIIHSVPMGKPRMTQRDKWKLRPSVVAYRAWCDRIRDVFGEVPEGVYRVDWLASFSPPESWSRRRKERMLGKIHQQKPDKDNIDKGVLDALFKHHSQNDAVVACGYPLKFWGTEDWIRIRVWASSEPIDADEMKLNWMSSD